MKNIRPKEQEPAARIMIYEFLVNYIIENGYAPSVKEIAKGTGLGSTSTVHYHLEMLEALGQIKVKPHISRGIRLTGYEFRKINT